MLDSGNGDLRSYDHRKLNPFITEGVADALAYFHFNNGFHRPM